METKKNPSKDLTLQRKKFFMIGLSITLAMVITAFEWTTVKKKVIVDRHNHKTEDIIFYPSITTIEYPKPPELKIEKEKLDIKPILPTEFVEAKNDEKVTDVEAFAEPEIGTNTSTVTFDAKPEEIDSIFIVAERQPEPMDGYASFYEQLSRKLKYPHQAIQMGTEGKVYVEFIVNKNGVPSDLKVIKGIGAGCDEEAMRVLSFMKWEPGKQRGKPVRVKMAMSLNFKLN
jgi:periplasmic protein TonB